MPATALVIDDEADLCRLMQITLQKMDIQTDVAHTLAAAHDLLDKNSYDFCLTDLKLPDGSGLDLVKQFGRDNNPTPIAVITAHGSMDLAIEALKYGAFDFVNKPLELPRLRQLVEHALRVGAQIANAPKEMPTKSPAQQLMDERLIGTSDAMQTLKATIIKLARSQAPVFLWGESGTGKEVVAKLIHELSPRREGSFVPVNCGAIPSELMESEFFGHKKGSFTGATTDKIGLFQQADGGTLFLDEVADLPLAMQVKLLRAIQEKTVRAIGDTKEVSVDIRILSATHKNLSQLVEQGSFRQDLFYRINVIELKLPTLNERGDDIKLLADFFLQDIANDWQLEEPLTMSDDAMHVLTQHQFAGNVRELRNLLERAVTLTESHLILPKHLGLEHQQDDGVANISGSTQASDTSQGFGHSHSGAHTDSEAHAKSPTVAHNSLQVSSSFAGNASGVSNTRHVGQSNAANGATESSVRSSGSTNLMGSFGGFATSHTLPTITVSAKSTHTDNENTTATQIPDEGLEAYLQEQEKQLIICALNKTNWNKTNAAKLLQMSFRSLRYRMKKLGIENDDE